MRAEVMTHTNLGVPSLEIDSHRCTATFRSWETKSSELSGETTLLEGGRERWWCQVLLLNLPECLLGLFQLLDAKVRSKMTVFSATRERWRRLWNKFFLNSLENMLVRSWSAGMRYQPSNEWSIRTCSAGIGEPASLCSCGPEPCGRIW